MNNIVLEIKNLKKNFIHKNNKIEVIKNSNLRLKRGELIALTGPSGSGKSTLLHLISLMDKPTNGKIFIFNKDTNKLKENEINKLRRQNISLIFQNNNLISDFTAIENVMLPLLIKDEDHRKSFEKSKKVLKSVNLENRMDYFPSDLSGGEQQRVAIARSMLNEPELIIADEPTGNLDPETSSEIISLFKKLNSMGTSMIIATHDYNLILKLEGQVYKCEDGSIFEVKRK